MSINCNKLKRFSCQLTNLSIAYILKLSLCHAVFVRYASGWTCLCSLQWRHNGRDGVSNHQPDHCLLNRLFWRRSKKTSKLPITGLFVGIHRWPANSPLKWTVTRKYTHLTTSSCHAEMTLMDVSILSELRLTISCIIYVVNAYSCYIHFSSSYRLKSDTFVWMFCCFLLLLLFFIRTCPSLWPTSS